MLGQVIGKVGEVGTGWMFIPGGGGEGRGSPQLGRRTPGPVYYSRPDTRGSALDLTSDSQGSQEG